MLTVILAASTGCKSTRAEAQIDTSGIIKNMAPELPELPAWPSLSWIYQDGLYCLTEEDVDKILDYRENKIPTYLYEMDIYKSKIEMVLEHL